MSWIPIDEYKPKNGKLIIVYTDDGLELIVKATGEYKHVVAWQYAPEPYKVKPKTNLYKKCGSCKYYEPTGFRTIYGYCGGICKKKECLYSRTKTICKLYELDEKPKFKDSIIQIGG